MKTLLSLAFILIFAASSHAGMLGDSLAADAVMSGQRTEKKLKQMEQRLEAQEKVVAEVNYKLDLLLKAVKPQVNPKENKRSK